MKRHKSLRSAVVGCRMGRAHAKSLAGLDEYELVALCDLDEATARKVAEENGNPAVFTDYATMLAKVKPDIVAIVTPTSSHAELTLQAVDAHVRGVYCEKPMATSLGDARKMVDECRHKQVALAINHQRRMSEPYLVMRQLMDQGAIGEPYLIRGSCAGDVLSDGTHTIDSILHLAGDAQPKWVFAQTHRPKPDPAEEKGMGYHVSGGWRYGHPVEAGALATFEFESGLRAELFTGDLRLPGRGYQDLEVVGAGGRLWRAGDQADPPLWLWNGNTSGWQPVPMDDPTGRNAIPDAYRAFAKSVTDGADHPLDGMNALRGFEVVMGIYESARVGERVGLPVGRDVSALDLEGR